MTTRISCFALALFSFSLHGAHVVYQKSITGTLMATDAAGNVYVSDGSKLTKLDAGGTTVYSKPLALPGDQFAIAADSAGNVFLAGDTNLDSLPVTPGVFQPKRNPGICIAGDRAATPYPCPDAFVVKIDPNGNLAWASYLGGNSTDQANGVATDRVGNVYVTGFTLSADFPTVTPFQKFGGYADMFVTKISADGTAILYSSTWGGSGYDVGHAIAVDGGGNAYVAGEVQSPAPPSASAGFGSGCAEATGAFLLKVGASGGLAFAGCLGAAMTASAATAVAVDQQGGIYLGGYTNSKSFPSTPGTFRHTGNEPYTNFLAKVAPDGSALQYSALFDGSSGGVTSIAVDANGAVYLAGGESSPDWPIVGPAMQPCPGPYFLLKLNPAGSAPLYSSFEVPLRLALAQDGSLYLAGSSLRKVVNLETPGDAILPLGCVLNAASWESHLSSGQPGISPGEIVTLKGTRLGPMAPPDPVVANGVVATSLGGVEVLFDGVAAPLLYVQDGQINTIAPYGLAGQAQTVIQVRYQGQTTNPVTLPVSGTSAALFQNVDGTPLVFNPDNSSNSRANPVPRGGALVMYLTGAGQTAPASVDGQVWQSPGGLALPVSARLSSYGPTGIVMAATPVLYAGPVPGVVAAVQQINIQIPADLPDSFVTTTFGTSVLSLTIGDRQVNVAVFVR